MSMREAIHIPEDDLIQYALGTLPEIQLGTLTAHISLCTECRGELSRIQTALASYAFVQPMEDLPAGARSRFMASLTTDGAESKLVQLRDNNRFLAMTRSFKEWLETPMPLKILTGVMAAAMLFFAYDDLSHIHEIRQLLPEMKRFEVATAELDEIKSFLRGDNAQQISLRPKSVLMKEPEGHALYSPTSGKLIFTATNVAALPAGKTYELWLLPAGGRAPIPSGLFTPDQRGSAAVIFPKLPANTQVAGFAVTVEDAAGASAPTSPIILSGQ